MMRQTASAIDRAVNVWTINNYKPNFDVDATVNPAATASSSSSASPRLLEADVPRLQPD